MQSDDQETEFNPSKTRRRKKRLQKKLYRVNMFGHCTNKDSISILRAIAFYHTAPVVKFYYHTVCIQSAMRSFISCLRVNNYFAK